LAEQARAQVLGINPAWVVDRLSQPWLEEEDESASCRNVVKNATPVIELLEKLDSMDPAYITLLAQ
jgi:HEPN domain-containing protein